MLDRKRGLSAVVVSLIVSAVACADMTSAGAPSTQRQKLKAVCSESNIQKPYSSDQSDIYDASALNVRFEPIPLETGPDISQPFETPDAIFLTEGIGSHRLCLYALLALGLYSAPHWIKKSSWGHIPEWYHDGGPFQIGHSFAVPPNSICPLPAYCFVQPVSVSEHLMPRHHLRIFVSLWYKSQFTPETTAARGPPLS